MAEKIFKNEFLKEISEKIKICETYQEQNPDIMAAQRVAALDKNPCGDGKYYVNVLLEKPGVLHTYTNPAEIVLKNSYEGSFFVNEKYKSFLNPFNGCIIEFKVKENTFSLTTFSDHQSMLEALFNKGPENIFEFNPKNSLLSDKYFDDDKKIATSLGMTTIIYSIGNFGALNSDETNSIKKAAEKFIKDEESAITSHLKPGDSESNKDSKLTIFSAGISSMPICKTFDAQPSNFEKKLYKVKGLENLNQVTLFGERNTAVKNGSLFKPQIFDFGKYIKNLYNEIIKSEAFETFSMSSKIEYKQEVQYKIFKQCLKGQELSKIGETGYEKIKNIKIQYNLFKRIYGTNKEFTKSVDSNSLYKANMLAFEKSELIISLYRNLKAAYKDAKSLEENGIKIEYPEDIDSKDKAKCEEFIKNNITQFKQVYLEVGNISSPDKNGSKKIKVPIFYTESEVSLLDKISLKSFFSNEDEYYKIIDVKLKWDNIKRTGFAMLDTISLNGEPYEFNKNIKADENPESFNNNLLNEITGEVEKPDLENVLVKSSLFNPEVPRFFFKDSDLLKRICTLKINFKCYYYPYTPAETERFFNVVITDTGTKKIMFSETKDVAEETKTTTEEIFNVLVNGPEELEDFLLIPPEISDEEKNVYFNGTPIKTFLDTINYDPWEIEINKLKDLAKRINEIPKHETDEKRGDYWLVGIDGMNLNGSYIVKDENSKPKLCDKLFPLDFFGVIGFLGLDSLAANFGLNSNIQMYIYDQSGIKMNYKQIVERFNKELSPNKFDKITYKDLEKYINSDTSIAFQFSDEDFKDFKSKYSEICKIKEKKKKEDALNELYSKKIKVGFADGYFYFPMGMSVSFKYSMGNPVFKLDGTTLPQTLQLKDIVGKYNSSEYETEIRKWAGSVYGETRSKNMNSLPRNIKTFLAYPFFPTPMSLLGQNTPDTPDDYTGDDMIFYIPDAESVKNFSKNIIKPGEIDVKFNVYSKRPMLCKYPKSKDPKCKSGENEGYCGLEECLKNGVELKSPVSFDLEKFLKEHTVKMKEKELAEKIAQYNQDVQSILDKSKNTLVNLGTAITSKNEALDTLYDLGKALNPVFRLLPLKCVVDAANDGRNAICAASRQAKANSVMEDEDSAFKQTLETISIVSKEAGEAYTKHFKESFKLVGEAASSMGSALSNVLDGMSNIYNWCPRRFGDFIAESGVGKGLQDSLTAVMKTNVSDILKGVLGSCITNGMIDEITSGINGLSNNAKTEFKNIIQSGNVDSIDGFARQYPQIMAKFGNGEGGLDVTKLMNESSFNMNVFNSIQEEMLKRMNPAAMIENAATSFMQPNNLIEFARKGVTSALSPQQSMGSTIMDSIKGTSRSAVQNQLGTNVDTLINTADNSKNAQKNTQVSIDSIRNYYEEKNKLYIALKDAKPPKKDTQSA